MDSYSSIRVRTATLHELTEVAHAMSKARPFNRHTATAKALKGVLTLEAVVGELLRVWRRERIRSQTYQARRKASKQAHREVAAQVAAEDVAQWESEGGSIPARG
jgi:hypothetical protein